MKHILFFLTVLAFAVAFFIALGIQNDIQEAKGCYDCEEQAPPQPPPPPAPPPAPQPTPSPVPPSVVTPTSIPNPSGGGTSGYNPNCEEWPPAYRGDCESEESINKLDLGDIQRQINDIRIQIEIIEMVLKC